MITISNGFSYYTLHVYSFKVSSTMKNVIVPLNLSICYYIQTKFQLFFDYFFSCLFNHFLQFADVHTLQNFGSISRIIRG